MRLTKAIRKEMEEAIMRDVPDDRKETFGILKLAAKQYYFEALPELLQQGFRNYPEYFQERYLRIFVRPENVTTWQSSPDDFMETVAFPHFDFDVGNLIKKEAWYKETVEKIKATTEKRYKARMEVQQALKSVTTAKRLKEVYPDLAKYLPSDISGQALAVPQSLPNLHNTGWPDETRKQDAESVEASGTG